MGPGLPRREVLQLSHRVVTEIWYKKRRCRQRGKWVHRRFARRRKERTAYTKGRRGQGAVRPHRCRDARRQDAPLPTCQAEVPPARRVGGWVGGGRGGPMTTGTGLTIGECGHQPPPPKKKPEGSSINQRSYLEGELAVLRLETLVLIDDSTHGSRGGAHIGVPHALVVAHFQAVESQRNRRVRRRQLVLGRRRRLIGWERGDRVV